MINKEYITKYAERREILKKGYTSRQYLADRLKRLLVDIKDDKDKVIHNDMLDDVVCLIGNNYEEFYMRFAELIFNISRMNVKVPVQDEKRTIMVKE